MRKTGKTKFDLAVISLVKEAREKRGLSQDDIAFFLDVTRGYIGHIESPNTVSKYNLNQLNRIAYEMGVSPREFIPQAAFDETVAIKRAKQKKKTRSKGKL